MAPIVEYSIKGDMMIFSTNLSKMTTAEEGKPFRWNAEA